MIVSTNRHITSFSVSFFFVNPSSFKLLAEAAEAAELIEMARLCLDNTSEEITLFFTEEAMLNMPLLGCWEWELIEEPIAGELVSLLVRGSRMLTRRTYEDAASLSPSELSS